MKLFKWSELPTDINKLSDTELFKLKEWLENEKLYYVDAGSSTKAAECTGRIKEIDDCVTGRDEFRNDFKLFEVDVKKGDAW